MSVPTSLFPCCVHTLSFLVNTQTAPLEKLSSGPPTIAVLPSAERETEDPCDGNHTVPLPTSLLPCCVHTPPLRVYTHAAPIHVLSSGPPTIAVFPSVER